MGKVIQAQDDFDLTRNKAYKSLQKCNNKTYRHNLTQKKNANMGCDIAAIRFPMLFLFLQFSRFACGQNDASPTLSVGSAGHEQWVLSVA